MKALLLRHKWRFKCSLKHTLKQQLILFSYALSYFTRIPMPTSLGFDNDQFHKANAYLPLVGFGIALIMVGILYCSQYGFSTSVSVIFMLIGGLLLTGALHEDGFADCCDGLGGGYSAEQRLKIMKDSQIGSYAGIGLIVLLLLKFNLLLALAENNHVWLFAALIVSHVMSRYGALCLMQTLPYVRLDSDSKLQALATKLPLRYFIFSSLSTVLCLLLVPIKMALLITFMMLIGTYLLRRLFLKNLNGYSGDCLGFAQQCLEILILLLFSLMLS